ncbi:MAG: hypothetical protein Q8R55_01705 [Candidatus Taylorbacteria bacterium]|nr:hypothetical protein [Candidatus Taylorbacteria bacterium]
MKVIEKDPRVPLRPYLLTPERESDMDRQMDEVIRHMHVGSIFIEKARDLSLEISNKIAEIEEEIAKKNTDDQKKKFLALDKTYQESRRRTPDQLAEEKRTEIKAEAVAVLTQFHNKWMAARLAQWQTTCRLDGCNKQPRIGRKRVATKNRRRTFVFCPNHAGVRNQIAKADYQRLKANTNLRVVA